MKKLTILLLIMLAIGTLLFADYPGNCLEFDGVDDRVDIWGIPTSLNDFTIECWVKHNGDATFSQRYVTLRSEAAALRCLNFNRMNFFVKQSDGSLATIALSHSSMPVGTWQHVAGTYDGSTLKLYLNGNLVGETIASVGGFYGNSGTCEISSYGETMQGCIDEVRIWNTARTASEIKENRFQSMTGSEMGLVALWHMDESGGMMIYDDAGVADGTMLGMDEEDRIASRVPTLQEDAGNAAVMFGDTQSIAVHAHSGLPIYTSDADHAYSVAMWVKGDPQDRFVYAEGNSDNPTHWSQFYMKARSSGKLMVYILEDSNSLRLMTTSETTVFDGQWHHVAWVDNNGTATLYIDGEPDGADFTYTRSGSFIMDTVGIGTNITGASIATSFDGQIDEVCVWDSTLSQSQLNQYWCSPLNGSESGLVGYWPCNETDGEVFFDLANGNNGIMVGATSSNRAESTAPVGTNFQGMMSSDTHWSGAAVYITGDVTVNNGTTLTIDPGTNVIFMGHYRINVQGCILAEGTEQDSILFTAYDPDLGWQGIRFINTPATSDSSRFAHCAFEKAIATGSGYDLNGSAMYVRSFNKVLLDHCEFRNNENTTPLYEGAGGALNLHTASIRMVNTTFVNNVCGNAGGAISIYNCSPVFERCRFLNNYAANAGGAIYASNGSGTYYGCLFKGNTSLSRGGAIGFGISGSGSLVNCLFDGNEGEQGGALSFYNHDSSFTVANCTFMNNTADQGGAIQFYLSTDKTIVNSLIWGNSAAMGNQIYHIGDCTTNYHYCDIQGGSNGFGYDGSGTWSGDFEHCFSIDPDLNWIGDYYTFSNTSPCINSGDPGTTPSEVGSVDIAGNPRFLLRPEYSGAFGVAMGRIDIGAVEDQSGSNVIPDGAVIDADITFYNSAYLLNERTLTVNPGVILRFDQGVRFYIHGNLNAIGDPENMITFTEISNSRWGGLLFQSDTEDSVASSVLEHCNITRAGSSNWPNITAENYDDLVIQNCVISDGLADTGGGVKALSSQVRLVNTVLTGNSASIEGRALYTDDSEISIINCTIAGNTETTNSNSTMYFNTITNQPQILNSLIWDNGCSPIYPGNGTLTDITYCNIEGTYPGTGNVNIDPSFEGSGNHPYSLHADSFCINMGKQDTTGLNLPNVDLQGNPRIHEHTNSVYDRIDIGAYEYPGYLAPSNLIASDGDNDYPGYVKLMWDFHAEYDPEPSGYRIFRNGINIDTRPRSTTSYSDYTCAPGEFYSYHVQAYNGTESGDSDTDVGYIKPNGVVSGNISTANNNPVAGVQVRLNPSPGYCLHFEDADNSIMTIDDPEMNMDYNYTIEFWIRTPLNSQTILERGNLVLAIDADGYMTVSNGNNTLTQTVDSVSVADNEWHHIALINDYTNTITTLYLDEYEVASTTNWSLDAGSAGEIISGPDFEGYLDDIRFWSAARTEDDIIDNMNIIAPVDEDALEGYWTFNEGTGSALFDGTSHAHLGEIINVGWSNDDPNIQLGALTDEWGEYFISQIPYGSSTTFSVTPYKAGHVFQPEQRLVTLSQSNIAQNGIDFIDNSMIPITGRVFYQGTSCPVAGAILELNGETALPLVMTDSDGYYTLEVEHGANCLVSISYNDHTFNRTWNLGTVTYPRTNINFEDTYKTSFWLEVVGGEDSYPIGDFDVTIQSENGCYLEEITNENWDYGGMLINNIPPLNFNITVNPTENDPFGLAIDQQFQDMKTQSINLTSPSAEIDTLRFEWHAPLEIEVAWPDTLELKHFNEYPENEFYVIAQNEWYSVSVKAFEDYSHDEYQDQKTYLSDCAIIVSDQISPSGDTEDSFNGENEYIYTFAPYLPNIQGDYERQYQNMLEFTVEDSDLNRYATSTNWAITEGVRPLESTYATTTPEIPFLILHDPPGDCSYASFDQSSSHTINLGVSVDVGAGVEYYKHIHLGPHIHQDVGFLYSQSTEIEFTHDLNLGLSVSISQHKSYEQEYTFTTSETYTTSDSDDMIGDFGADVFVGGAMNLLWGVTKVVEWDDNAQDVNLSQDVMVSPNGFSTVYIYTASQIENTVIPSLLALGDTESADLWQSYLDMNEENKENAIPNPNHPNNISFCAGPSYTYQEETTANSTRSFEFETTVSTEFGTEIGGTINGMGGEEGFTFSAHLSLGASSSTSNETTTTTTFVLADDDVASDLTFNSDYFTVDIGVDPVYGTPVFDLVSGASSSHWEPNTQPRDGVMLTANTYTADNLAMDAPALFLLYLTNTSQTNEPRRYYLTVQHGTNTTGATIKINNVILEERMAFDLNAGETRTALLTVEPGPLGYDLEGLTIEFYAEGDRGYEGPEDHYFDYFRSFDIHWDAPYSRVALVSPQEDWLGNTASGDSLTVMFSGYDLTIPTFRSIRLQYKHPQDTNWLPAFEVFRDSLEAHPNYIYHDWNISGIADGIWQIRAVATDSLLSEYHTNAVSGIIDRHGPDVFGMPQPADGIMQHGDEISVTFTEEINPQTVIYENVIVEVLDTGLIVDCSIETYENRIIITPNIANYWLENHTMRVIITGVEDLYGNPIDEAIEWEFYVNANPVGWDIGKIEVIKPLGEEMTLTVELINRGGGTSSFTIDDIPNWLSVNPTSGILLPLDSEIITLTISNQLGFGAYLDTLYAVIPGLGMEPLVIDIGVLSNPPTWSTEPIGAYDYSMSITGQMSIEGEISQDNADVIGAFVVNSEGDYVCRGFARTAMVSYLSDVYVFYLTIQSDIEYGEEIVFRIWDASECKEHIGTLEDFSFIEGAVFGTPVTPTVLHAESELVSSIHCNQGWTWFSTNLENQTSMSVNNLLANLHPNTGDLVKNQTEYAQFIEGTGWICSLTEIEPTRMVKIKLSNQDDLVLTGLLEDPYAAAISYGSGWNWIGYIPHVSVSVNEALADIDNLTTGDLIKNQRGFAQYIEGYGWTGSLLFMNPNEGYMLNTANAGTFHYPDYDFTRNLDREMSLQRVSAVIPDVPGWVLNPLDYEFSANITGSIWKNGALLQNPDIIIGAFAGDECRGIASAINVQGNQIYFLTVYSNAYIDELTFKTWNRASNEYTDLDESLTIVSNQIIGDPMNPHPFEMPLGMLCSPLNLIITVSSSEIRLSWDAVENASSYKIYSCDNPLANDEDWTLEEVVSSTSWIKILEEESRFYRVVASSDLPRP